MDLAGGRRLGIPGWGDRGDLVSCLVIGVMVFRIMNVEQDLGSFMSQPC